MIRMELPIITNPLPERHGEVDDNSYTCQATGKSLGKRVPDRLGILNAPLNELDIPSWLAIFHSREAPKAQKPRRTEANACEGAPPPLHLSFSNHVCLTAFGIGTAIFCP
jgi:hypothetical protein